MPVELRLLRNVRFNDSDLMLRNICSVGKWSILYWGSAPTSSPETHSHLVTFQQYSTVTSKAPAFDIQSSHSSNTLSFHAETLPFLLTFGWSRTGTTTLTVTLMGLSLVMSTMRRCSPPSLLRAEEEPIELFSLPLLLSVEREGSFMTMSCRVLTSTVLTLQF